jgi:hypothetical protein
MENPWDYIVHNCSRINWIIGHQYTWMICSVQDVPVQICTLRSRHPFGENSNVATVFAVLAQCFPLNPSGLSHM